jgi:hypothetical protein
MLRKDDLKQVLALPYQDMLRAARRQRRVARPVDLNRLLGLGRAFLQHFRLVRELEVGRVLAGWIEPCIAQDDAFEGCRNERCFEQGVGCVWYELASICSASDGGVWIGREGLQLSPAR